MALKVVPAGDERCDIHNRRQPPRYVCETCLNEMPVGSAPRAGARRRARRAVRRVRRLDTKVLVAAGAGVIALVVLVVLVTGGGGSAGPAAPAGPPARTTAGVVDALDLVPSPGGTGWTTPDGACWVVSIQFGKNVHPGRLGGPQLVEATNEDATVGAAVAQNDYSVSESRCVARIAAGLRDNF